MARGRAEARRLVLRQLVEEGKVHSQDEAVQLLRASGYRVTQATVSRDLTTLGANKGQSKTGDERYVIGSPRPAHSGLERLRNVMIAHMVGMAVSENLVVLKTHPAGAGPVAAALDDVGVDGVVGTLAGDDTVLIVADENLGGKDLKQRLQKILEDEQ